MEQAALLMMQRVVEAELGATRQMFALMRGPVATRGSGRPRAVPRGEFAGTEV